MYSDGNRRPLEGQRALVTRANIGNGPTVALALAEAGAKVMINYLDQREKAQQVAELIRAKEGQAMIFQADVSQENQVKSMFDVLIAYWGSVDILVNNTDLQNNAALVDMSLEQWNHVINFNLTGQFLCVREAVREFLRRGEYPELSKAVGKIICMSLLVDENSSVGYFNYAAAKGGLTMFMKMLAKELAKDNIRVNGIAPITCKSSSNRIKPSMPDEKYGLLSPRCKFRDIAQTAVWLASDESDTISGMTCYIENRLSQPSELISAL